MTRNLGLIYFLLVMSVLVWLVPLVNFVIKHLKDRKVETVNSTPLETRLMFCSLSLVFAVWCLRFATSYYEGTSGLSVAEMIFDSLLQTLQTVTMNVDCREYIVSGKAMIQAIFSGKYVNAFVSLYGIYASILNLLAPAASAAALLSVLTTVFPKLKLKASCFRKQYYFSELNERSLALAKSIVNSNKRSWNRPLLVFTDVYVDDENEQSSEIYLNAKKLGAICVKNDITHLKIKTLNEKEIFLMDENEFGNLQTLVELTENRNIKFLKATYIFLFVRSDAYVQLEKQINKDFENKEKRKFPEKSIQPTIVPINEYRNLIQNLFVDVPLYEPLINKRNNNKISIAIFGNGIIGTEAFLNAYWFGQMMVCHNDNGKKLMSECEMTINIVSKDCEDVFWSKIDYINSEIKRTIEVLDNYDCDRERELLCYDSKGQKNKPYCRVKYIKSDVKVGSLWNSDSKEIQQLLKSDYFIVALGDDADNISIADKLFRTIGRKHVENKNNSDNKAVIAYAVFDSKIAEKLNANKYRRTVSDGKTDIYMYAFGNLDNVYSCDNLYMSRYTSLAESMDAAYDESQIQRNIKNDNNERKDNENSNYNYWANLARAMHIKYKAFSLGMINESIFDYNSNDYDADKKHRTYIAEKCRQYIKLALAESSESLCNELAVEYKDVQLKKHVLAWLEHRRWNAFTRTMGYQHIDADKIFDVKNSQKDMELKLHSCLVEARLPQLTERDTYKCDDYADSLDYVSHKRNQHNPSEVTDYKEYDYYNYDVHDDSVELSQLLELI